MTSFVDNPWRVFIYFILQIFFQTGSFINQYYDTETFLFTGAISIFLSFQKQDFYNAFIYHVFVLRLLFNRVFGKPKGNSWKVKNVVENAKLRFISRERWRRTWCLVISFTKPRGFNNLVRFIVIHTGIHISSNGTHTHTPLSHTHKRTQYLPHTLSLTHTHTHTHTNTHTQILAQIMYQWSQVMVVILTSRFKCFEECDLELN